jgi:hypothetical protein
MCENTNLGMNQIIEAMQEEGVAFLKDLAGPERRAYEELYFACQSFLNLVEELEDKTVA